MKGVRGLNRRCLLATAVGAALPNLTVAQGRVEFLMLTMTTKNFPFNTLANCAELNKSVALFAAASKRVKDSPHTVAAEISKRVDDRRAALLKAISDAKTALANAKVDEAFVFVNIGISSTLLGLGAAFTSPLALGVLAGASVLTSASSFAVQAYFRKGSGQLSFVTGYGQSRAMMFVEIATAASAPVLSSGLNAVGYFVAANEYASSRGTDTSRPCSPRCPKP